MEKLIKLNGNFIIGLQVIPYDYAKYSVVEIRIYYKHYLLLQEKVDWVPFIHHINCEQELTPQSDEFIMEFRQVEKEVVKIKRDALAGRITEEFFKNQEVDAEQF